MGFAHEMMCQLTNIVGAESSGDAHGLVEGVLVVQSPHLRAQGAYASSRGGGSWRTLRGEGSSRSSKLEGGACDCGTTRLVGDLDCQPAKESNRSNGSFCHSPRGTQMCVQENEARSAFPRATNEASWTGGVVQRDGTRCQSGVELTQTEGGGHPLPSSIEWANSILPFSFSVCVCGKNKKQKVMSESQKSVNKNLCWLEWRTPARVEWFTPPTATLSTGFPSEDLNGYELVLQATHNKRQHSLNGNPPRKRGTRKGKVTVVGIRARARSRTRTPAQRPARAARRRARKTQLADQARVLTEQGYQFEGKSAIRGRGDYTIGRGIGSSIGGWIGDKLEGFVRKIFGVGDYSVGKAPYEVAQNSLIAGTTAPAMHSDNSGATEMAYHEFIGNIGMTTDFSVKSYPINITHPQTFPWVSHIAKNYQQWELIGCIFFLRTLSSDTVVAPVQGLGSVVGAVRYDVNSDQPKSKMEIANSMFASSCKPSQNMALPLECAPNQTILHPLKVQTSGVEPDEPQFYQMGWLDLATEGAPNDYADAMELHVVYHLRLYKPRLTNGPDTLFFMADLLGTDSNTVIKYVQNTIAVKQPRVDNIGLSKDSSDNVLYFPLNLPVKSYWYMRFLIAGDGGTLDVSVPIFTYGGGIQLVNAFFDQQVSKWYMPAGIPNKQAGQYGFDLAFMYDGTGTQADPPFINFSAPGATFPVVSGTDTGGMLMITEVTPAFASGLRSGQERGRVYTRGQFFAFLCGALSGQKGMAHPPGNHRLCDWVELFKRCTEWPVRKPLPVSQMPFDLPIVEALAIMSKYCGAISLAEPMEQKSCQMECPQPPGSRKCTCRESTNCEVHDEPVFVQVGSQLPIESARDPGDGKKKIGLLGAGAHKGDHVDAKEAPREIKAKCTLVAQELTKVTSKLYDLQVAATKFGHEDDVGELLEMVEELGSMLVGVENKCRGCPEPPKREAPKGCITPGCEAFAVGGKHWHCAAHAVQRVRGAVSEEEQARHNKDMYTLMGNPGANFFQCGSEEKCQLRSHYHRASDDRGVRRPREGAEMRRARKRFVLCVDEEGRTKLINECKKASHFHQGGNVQYEFVVEGNEVTTRSSPPKGEDPRPAQQQSLQASVAATPVSRVIAPQAANFFFSQGSAAPPLAMNLARAGEAKQSGGSPPVVDLTPGEREALRELDPNSALLGEEKQREGKFYTHLQLQRDQQMASAQPANCLEEEEKDNAIARLEAFTLSALGPPVARAPPSDVLPLAKIGPPPASVASPPVPGGLASDVVPPPVPSESGAVTSPSDVSKPIARKSCGCKPARTLGYKMGLWTTKNAIYDQIMEPAVVCRQHEEEAYVATLKSPSGELPKALQGKPLGEIFRKKKVLIYFSTREVIPWWKTFGERFKDLGLSIVPFLHRVEEVTVSTDAHSALQHYAVKPTSWAWFGRWAKDARTVATLAENDVFSTLAQHYPYCGIYEIYEELFLALRSPKMDLENRRDVIRGTDKFEFSDAAWTAVFAQYNYYDDGKWAETFKFQDPFVSLCTLLYYVQYKLHEQLLACASIPEASQVIRPAFRHRGVSMAPTHGPPTSTAPVRVR